MTLHHGDCLEVMPTLPAESIDAIVTDPPYGLHFMGKTWDKFGGPLGRRHTNQDRERGGAMHAGTYDFNRNSEFQAWFTLVAREMLRVAKPGAYLLAFGGTRTYHRLACAIEDAGWEIRDCLVWAYASGFPKSRNLDGEWQGWGTALKPAWEPILMARKPLRGTVAANVQRYGTGALNIDGCRIGTEATMTRIAGGKGFGTNFRDDGWVPPSESSQSDNPLGRWPANVILTDPIFDGDTPGVVGGGEQTGGGNPRWRSAEALDRSYHGNFGGGETGLEPFDTSGTYSRFFLIPKASRADREPVLGGQLRKRKVGVGVWMAGDGHREYVHDAPSDVGEFIRSARIAAGMSAKELCARIGAHGEVNHGGAVSNWESGLSRPTPEQWRALKATLGFDGRYDRPMTETREVPPAPVLASEKNPNHPRANHHPTVKPTELMRHLVRLVTPPGGTVLDPFLGSGSTALACEMEGFGWVGIEKEAEYVAIAEARLNGTQRGIGL